MQLLFKIAWRSLKKLKIELPYDPAIPLPSTYPKRMKMLTWKERCTAESIAARFTVAGAQKQPKCPSTDDWLKKTGRHYICVGLPYAELRSKLQKIIYCMIQLYEISRRSNSTAVERILVV